MKTVLFGIPPTRHRELALEEVKGMEERGYDCHTINYGLNRDNASNLKRLEEVFRNSIAIVKQLYHLGPSILYLNSRIEPVASIRDFITVLVIKALFRRPLKIIVKSHGSNLNVLESKSLIYKYFIIPALTKHVNRWLLLSTEELRLAKLKNDEFGRKCSVTCNIIAKSLVQRNDLQLRRFSIMENRFKFLYVGRIVDVKGIYFLLKAFNSSILKPSCTLIFVGDGPDFESLKAEALRLHLNECVTFVGKITEKQCDVFYANCDCLIFPSFDSEGFPMALFKAVAAGLPVISTQIRAAKDHLTSPANCLWISERSLEEIKLAMETLYADNELRDRMKVNNVELGSKFSRDAISAQMDDIFSLI